MKGIYKNMNQQYSKPQFMIMKNIGQISIDINFPLKHIECLEQAIKEIKNENSVYFEEIEDSE